MTDSCSGNMSAQGKHSSDPAADKPDRRRGAAGRAAALRRAPSDSDCSGETASLSADSGERRPPPPPPRGKTRNRRRGSEWEVLEGLKDGQRFERRPEVFNGFLHKKRKWPLKGWHKRFFVVDGGILVYARSPTDVARGRLHGSLDVGLSVISAKPRRRRIDIDADEFIYHLRAKTPDVFRTWLNVLKAHRLYRQHLLTFGARESVPKIHAPHDDLPPTDTSSRTSQTSRESLSSPTKSQTYTKSSRLCVSELTSSVYENKSYNALLLCKIDENILTPVDSNEPGYDSLCSMHCIEKRQDNGLTPSQIIPSVDEQQMHSTDLELNTLNSSNIASESPHEMKSNKSLSLNNKRSRKNDPKQTHEMQRQLNTLENINTRLSIDNSKKSTVWLDNKDPTALYFFSRKRRHRNKNEEDWAMKRSRKSTNLVKYRNSRVEPCLTRPQLRQMLLCKYKHNIIRSAADKHVNCDLYNYNKKTDKSTQDAITASEYDDICEKLVFNLFDNFDRDCNPNGEGIGNSSLYVNLVVKELYDLKLNASKKHPIKSLFKSLLQYFLKTTEGKFKGSIKQDKATDKPSNTHFCRDIAVSNIINNAYKLTPESEDIEKLINSTIYGCSIGKRKSRETDIAITKTLINNLDALSTTFSNMAMEDNNVNSTDSAELPLLKKYFKHILSETSISKAVAKDFLNAYLDVLDQRSRSAASSVSSEISGESFINLEPICEIQTECIQKKISKCISACKTDTCVGDTIRNPTDRSKLNIKEILDKIMDLFSSNKVDEEANEYGGTDINKNDNTDTVTSEMKSEDQNSKDASGTINDNKIVIDLSRYDIDNISLSNSESGLGPKCMTINLKEKIPHSNETKLKNSTLNITAGTSDKMKSDSDNTNPDYQTYVESNKDELSINPQVRNDEEDIQTLSSGATSKANLNVTNDNFLDMSSNNTMFSKEIPHPNCKENTQCFFVSSIKEDMPKIQEKLKKSHDFMSSSLPAQNSMSKSGVTEDFILRILEHLIAMSRDIPGLNRDIKKLYLKSKKAYEEADVTGLSLLGKIYKKDNNKKSSDVNHINSSKSAEVRRNVKKKAFEMAVNTSLILPTLKILENRALSAIIFAEALANIAVQTLSIDDEVNDRQIENNNQDEWFKKLTQEYVKNNALKCMLKKYQHLPQSIRIAHPIRAKVPERFSVSKNTSMTTTELTNLSPPLISNRSQKNIIEQLYNRKSKLVKAESMTDSSVHFVNNDKSDDLKTLYKCTSEHSYFSGLISPNGAPIRGPQAGFVSGTPGGRLAGWIVESGGPLESASRELGQAQLSVQQLQRLLDAMLELQNIHHHDTDVSLEGASPNVKKDRRKFGLRKKKSNSKCASVELAPHHVDTSSSHMALSALTAPPSPGGGASSMPNSAASLPIACAAARPQSLPGAEALGVGTGGGPASLTSLTPDHQLREDFTILAKDLVANLKTVVSTLVVERGRLRTAMEAAETPAAGGVVAALRSNLTSALQQNSELRSRLSRIHDASDLAEISSVGNNSDQQAPRPFPQSLSYSSSCVSASEFFDAEEHEDELKPTQIIATDEAGVIELDGDSSSEAGSLSSEEGSASSDNSDGATSAVIPAERTSLQNGSEPLPTICTRRSRLPCPRPTPASPSLWNLLYKNIGKDLSQISMPVTINEPLNMLQRLCEELEYSELLDSASSCNNELERMSLIAAFAVSAYAASAHRAASKPFNPLLAETYEYVRGNRDFRFIAEQVSHHPPISACHAESPRWTFWQEARIKTKFWGKSMEFQPTGRVHVRLTPSGDHYSWNKVTTCVHNLFGGQRWVDQYGDMHIMCHGTDITCKLQFIKASSWSSSRHEVRGVVAVGGSPRMRLQGRWSEGLQGGERTLWRPGAMPPDYELYYGFTRFAMELNELEPGMRDVLPSTDTRLRPDQRALEEGDVDAAEQFKHELEQAQRERRRDGVEHSPMWFRKTIEDGEETWVFTGEYWKAREAGFRDTPRLW